MWFLKYKSESSLPAILADGQFEQLSRYGEKDIKKAIKDQDMADFGQTARLRLIVLKFIYSRLRVLWPSRFKFWLPDR